MPQVARERAGSPRPPDQQQPEPARSGHQAHGAVDLVRSTTSWIMSCWAGDQNTAGAVHGEQHHRVPHLQRIGGEEHAQRIRP